jgi:Ca2+ transporting ATPase
LIFVSLLAYNVAHVTFSPDKKLFSNATLMDVSRIGILAICILIVAIPEGLPLAISIAMAFSISAMKKDNVLIKNIQSVQVCALLHEICVGKTGTLTVGKMHVASFQFLKQGMIHVNNYLDAGEQAYFNRDMKIGRTADANRRLKNLIKEAIVANTDVRIEVDEGDERTLQASYLANGQALECAMVDFLMENQEDVYNSFIQRNKLQQKIIQLPFDQVLKRKTVIREDATNDKMCRIYVKGAPEVVIQSCTATFDENHEQVPLSRADQQQILNMIGQGIAAKGQKPLTYAFKLIDKQELCEILENVNEDSDEYRQIFESQLFYLGTFGLDDPIRENIDVPINEIKYGTSSPEADQKEAVVVKMITGDHLDTAKAVAVASGIIREDELEGEDADMVAMTGEAFRAKIGSYEVYWNEQRGMECIKFENDRVFKKLNKKVRVIARATPEDKFIMIRGIQQDGGLIAMAGDSIADMMALKTADVGLCMGSGCDVAKDNSDLIIMDNNFVSI